VGQTVLLSPTIVTQNQQNQQNQSQALEFSFFKLKSGSPLIEQLIGSDRTMGCLLMSGDDMSAEDRTISRSTETVIDLYQLP